MPCIGTFFQLWPWLSCFWRPMPFKPRFASTSTGADGATGPASPFLLVTETGGVDLTIEAIRSILLKVITGTARDITIREATARLKPKGTGATHTTNTAPTEIQAIRCILTKPTGVKLTTSTALTGSSS
jgi:hypothetical protein